ncbi:MAG: hypothetical protein IT335_03120 [Thermomicrobiales bacterium]|nr:hypothetical protein [Thermomicrobiales bacterium]
MSEQVDVKLRLAEFLRQALSLEDVSTELAEELSPFKQDDNAGIWTIELESSVGVAPFMIYHYLLEIAGADGRTGKTLFDADLKTLERSAMIDSPGPRILAHAVAEGEAFILATTPAAHRSLTGEGEYLPPADDDGTERSEAASKLIEALAEANKLAGAWLAALRADSIAQGKNPQAGEFVEFNEAETGLALYVLDDRSIRDLLATLNLMIESARNLRED